MVVVASGGEGVIESLLSLAGLLIDELAADSVFVGEAAEGLCSSEGIEGEKLTLLRVEAVGGARSVGGKGPLARAGGRMVAHVCFLLMTGFLEQPQCREAADVCIPESTFVQIVGVLPRFEPRPLQGVVQSQVTIPHLDKRSFR